MRILWLDPFHGGSHAAVSAGYAAASQHEVQLLTLPIDGGWRWRMRGAAVALAGQARHLPRPDLLVTTDLLDAACLRALLPPDWSMVPLALYFHENQLTYPLPSGRERDLSFAWINYTSALCADAIFFNSAFHRRAFLEALPDMLGRYHDYQGLETIATIAARAQVLHPGLDLASLGPPPAPRQPNDPPVLLWNARWEYDKQPEHFFAALEGLAARGQPFELIVAGEHIDPNHAAFVAARTRWQAQSRHWGYAPSRAAYGELLAQADLVVSCARQEFFGIAVLEALAMGCVPCLPKRLAYPELLPASWHDCLYSHDTVLVEALIAQLEALPALRARAWRGLAERFAWPQQAAAFDAAFAAVARHAGD